MQFQSECARRCAAILIAQCQDLALGEVEPLPNGHVIASIGWTDYEFAWDIAHQCVVLVQRVDLITVTYRDQAA